VLPEGVACYAIAATMTPAPAAEEGKAEGRRSAGLRGDGLVAVDSALGRHVRPELALGFPRAQHWLAYGAGHLDLLDRRDVYDTLRGWLSAR
jgi:hypothetical protein